MSTDARDVARLVAGAGWPVVPIRTDTDTKAPLVAWVKEPEQVCRSEADVVNNWPSRWPRWATICGVPRALDGRALVNLDADSPAAVDAARSLLHGYTRVRTGRPEGGEHTWLSIPREQWERPEGDLLSRFFIGTKLDWRGGKCIALLPGSLWAPVLHPGVTYDHIEGPALPEVLDVPLAVANVIRRMAPQPTSDRLVGAATPSGGAGHGRGVPPSGLPINLSVEGAFEKFLATAAAHSGLIVKRSYKAGEAFVQCPALLTRIRTATGQRCTSLLGAAGSGCTASAEAAPLRRSSPHSASA